MTTAGVVAALACGTSTFEFFPDNATDASDGGGLLEAPESGLCALGAHTPWPQPGVPPTTADCRGPGSNIDLLRSADDCGECGHSCLGAQCQDGMCIPDVVYQPAGTITLLSLDGDRIFYLNETNGMVDVASVGKDSSSPQPLATVTGAIRGAMGESSDFFVLTSSGAWIVPRTGGPATAALDAEVPIVDVTMTANANMTMTANARFWTTPSGEVMRMVIDGGEPEVFASGQTSIASIRAIDPAVYWLLNPAFFSPARGAASIVGTERGDKSFSEYVVGLQDPGALAADRHYLYWPDRSTGQLLRLDPAAESKTPEVVSEGPTFEYIDAIATDERWVYWAGHTFVDRLLLKAPRCGGPARIIARYEQVKTIISDGTYLFRVGLGVIRRMAI